MEVSQLLNDSNECIPIVADLDTESSWANCYYFRSTKLY